jgi:Fe-S cluster assembly protein SufD
MENYSNIKNCFDTFIKNFETNDTDLEFRKRSINHFLQNGYPGVKNEDWKYSPLTKDLKKFINFNISKSLSNDLPKLYLEEFDHYSIVFNDGILVSKNILIEGLKIEKNSNYLKSIKKEGDNSVLNLNNAFAENGYLIEIEKNTKINKPVVIYYYYSNHFKSNYFGYKNFILLNENSSISLYEKPIYENDTAYLTTSNTEIFLSRNSVLKKFDNNISNKNSTIYNFVKCNLDEESYFESFNFSKNINSRRDETIINLNGKNSFASVNAVQLLHKDCNHEIKLLMNHNEENTKSSQFIKTALYDQSNSSFQGKIFVDSKAQKTDGYQLSRALLLSDNAKFFSKPELEIYADDVKCSHGSSSGNIDDESIFYLRSRGINEKDAKDMMIKGFLAEVIDKITDKNFQTKFYQQLGYVSNDF